MKIKALKTFTAFTGQMNVFNTDDTGELPNDVALQFIESGHAQCIDGSLAQLDHDGDGKPGGSVSAEGDEIAALRKEYKEAFGKQPFNGWDADTLRAKIAERAGNDGDGKPGNEEFGDDAEDDAPAA